MRALLLLLLLWSGVGHAAPQIITSSDGLARWLARLARARDGARVEARARSRPFSLSGIIAREGRRLYLREAELRLGPLSAEGRLEIRRTRRPRGVALTATLSDITVRGASLGAGRLSAAWGRGTWTGTLDARGGVVEALKLRLTPPPEPRRCAPSAPCPDSEGRLKVELEGLRLGEALAGVEAPDGLDRLGGVVSARGHVGGALGDPWGALEFTGAPTWGGHALGTLTARLRREERAEHGLEIEARLLGPLADALHLRVAGAWRLDALKGLTWRPPSAGGVYTLLEVEGADLARWTERFPRLALEGRARFRLERFARGAGTLSLSGDALRWRGAPLGQISLDGRIQEETLRATLSWRASEAHEVRAEAEVPITLDPRAARVAWRDDAPGRVEIEARGLTPQILAPFWRAHPAARFELGGALRAEGTLATLKLRGALTGTLEDRAERLPLRGTVEVDASAQRLTLSVGAPGAPPGQPNAPRGALLDLEAATRAPLRAIREGRRRWEPSPLEGRVRIKARLPTLAPYLPRVIYDPRGTLAGEVTLGGTLGAPTFDGRLELPEGALTLTPLRQRLHHVHLTADLEGDTLTLSRFEAKSGIGEVTGGGSSRLTATPLGAPPPEGGLWSAWRREAALHFTLRRLPFLHDLTPAGLIDARVEVEATEGPGSTELRVRVREAAVRLTRVQPPTPRAVPYNHRVRVLDWAGDPEIGGRALAGAGRLDLTLELADPVPVEGARINLLLGGTLRLRRDEAEALVEGGLDILEGRFELFDHAFTFERGRLSLQPGRLDEEAEGVEAGHVSLRDPNTPPEAEPLEPVFDILARGRAIRTHIDVQVRGPARRPELVLTSDPPLPEYRVLTLLITGRVDAVDDRNGEVRREVAKLVDRFHNPDLSRQLYDRLGVDKLGVGLGESISQPILTVGKQVSRQLYVETVYHHNAPPEANEKEARVEYRLDPRWTLDTAYGDAAVGSLGVFWRTDWGGVPPKRPSSNPAKSAPQLPSK